MAKAIKKRFLFIIGLFVTSLVGSLTGFFHSQTSTKNSLLATTAFADTAPAPGDPGYVAGGDGGGGGGSDGGGCSDGCY